MSRDSERMKSGRGQVAPEGAPRRYDEGDVVRPEGMMGRLRLMTYNILDGPGDRLEDLASVVASIRPDLLACEEVTDPWGLLQLAARVGMWPRRAPANGPEVPEADRGRANLAAMTREHVVLLSRHPVIAFKAHRGDPRLMFRAVLDAVVAVPGLGVVSVVAVHLRSFPGPSGALFKVREADVAAVVVQNAATTSYQVVMGDFNAWVRGEGEPDKIPGGYPEDHLAAIVGGVTDVIRAAGVEDIWRIRGCAPEDVPGTVPGLGRRSPVDHIMLSPALARLLQAVTVPDTPVARRASDHLPVVADLVFDEAGATP